MRFESKDNSVEVVTRKAELVEITGLVALFVFSFLLAGGALGFGLLVGITFGAVVMHSALRGA